MDLQLSWHALRASATPPLERRGHASANLDNQWILVHGGSTATGPTADLFALKIDLETPAWVKVDDAGGALPPPLTGHSACIVFFQTPQVRAELLTFGGKTVDGSENNAVYSLDVVRKEWRRLYPNGTAPSARYGHTATVIGRTVIVFGGRAGADGFFNDVHVLDVDQMHWEQKAVTGTPPCARYAHTAVCGANGTKIYVFGGSNGNETFNDLYVLDTDKWTWEELYVTGLVPDARAYHVASLLSGRFMLVQGGSNGANCFSDAVLLDFSIRRWTRVQVAGGRYNIFQHTASVAFNGSKIFVFGGHNGTSLTSELRVLHVSASAPTPSKFAQLMPAVGVEGILARLTKLVGEQPQTRFLLTESELLQLCDGVKSALQAEGSLAEFPVPAQLYGDIHGQFYDLLKLFEHFGYPDNKKSYVFLGDYVDRGKQSLEVLTMLFAYKVKYPRNVCLLRGNHEDERINCLHGFLDECLHTYSYNAWKAINDVFNVMPLAGIVGERIFCLHGGLSPRLMSVHQIRDIHKPTGVPADTMIEDLLWSDPAEDMQQLGFVKRARGLKRGCSYDFGPDEVERFLQRNRLDMMVRAHEVVQDGFEMYADGRLVTLFSAPNYCGEYDNAGAIMCVDEDFVIDFKVLQPAQDVHLTAEAAPAGYEDEDAFANEFAASHEYSSPYVTDEQAARRCISPPRHGPSGFAFGGQQHAIAQPQPQLPTAGPAQPAQASVQGQMLPPRSPPRKQISPTRRPMDTGN
eukprot:TRINITY_DN7364_c0_g2_i1.p1 TRINITY_DN7364_c0_g2~~TRINITY_DN7364_c0_g2_i1.p1  ORF type:complete len:746 (+),score=176.04 TRINITY_DN7364_c0_g2_i1:100-2337(+)